MRYMGSKARIAKHILPIVLEGRKPGQWYVEPFVGGANVIHLVGGRRIGGDSNVHIITLLKALQNGFVPPNTMSEREHGALRASGETTPLKAFAMFGCSFGGSWNGGYARGGGLGKTGAPRNHCAESARNLMRQVPGIRGVEFVLSGYADLAVPANSLVYCDPPYKGTANYGAPFDYIEFWGWVRAMSTAGHRVFVSEYAAPGDFRCVWKRETTTTMRNRDGGAVTRTEKLFAPGRQAV